MPMMAGGGQRNSPAGSAAGLPISPVNPYDALPVDGRSLQEKRLSPEQGGLSSTACVSRIDCNDVSICIFVYLKLLRLDKSPS